LQEPQQLDDPLLQCFTIPNSEAPEAISFSGVVPDVGGVFEDVMVTSAAEYFAGYIGRRLNAFHIQKQKTNIQDCSACDNIFKPHKDYLCSFMSLKEYAENVDSLWGLKYCTANFVSNIVSLERAFLYCFSKYSYNAGFLKAVKNFFISNMPHPVFCSTEMRDHLMELYVRVRTFQTVKVISSKLRLSRLNDKKMKKIKGQ